MLAPYGLGYTPPISKPSDTQLWGIPLDEATRRSDDDWLVPGPIRFAVDYILSQERYIKEEGLFRIPGSVTRVNEIKQIFEEGKIPKLDVWEVETAASVLLNFLKISRLQADDDPFSGPGNMREQFAEANANNDVTRLKDLLRKHSLSKRETLSLFLRIEEYTEYNKMTIHTLSLSFGTQFARCFSNIVRNYAVVFPNTIVFGVPFSVALQRGTPSKDPAPLAVSIKFIEDSGFGRGERGLLYANLDLSKRTKQYKYEFNSGHIVHYLPGDIHCAATVIVWFVTSTHIFDSKENEERLTMVMEIADEKEQVKELELALKALPSPNLSCIGKLCKHLHMVLQATSREGANLRNICNSFDQLAEIFYAIVTHISHPNIACLFKWTTKRISIF
eukprot:TRINITY_DN4139_c0_g1_i2.p1 TRINITY_DN4139_c0_g1~~TRINITY_DN4139_c0_g1_i2.p1  ORF type:complete len:390 (-),score=62.57 TRINITY_DN4139_c0_g1_i2:169-1338(-)